MAKPTNPITPPFIEPPRLGLLRTVTAQQVSDQEVGFKFQPESCGESGTGDPSWCNEDNDKPIPDRPAQVDQAAFYIWSGDKCSAFGVQENLENPDRDWAARARRQLAATESFRVAHELWTGTISQAESLGNAYLASPDSDEVTDGATSPTDALARLEYALGVCMSGGGRRVIHATTHLATYWEGLNLVRREGNVLLTVLDTLVIPDAGYDGSGPDGSPAAEDSQWAYGTGLPIVQLAPVHIVPDRLAEALNRADNTIEYRAERQAAVGWDGCCLFAAQVDLGWAAIGGIS